MRSLRALLRRSESALLATREAPHRAALALATGVFLSFSPFLGLQIALGLTLAWLFRLNKVLVFVGLCSNLPWFVPAYYAATTEAAAWVMGITPPSELAVRFADVFAHSVVSRAFWRETWALVRPLFWPFIIGSLAAAALLGLAAYGAALALLVRRRRR